MADSRLDLELYGIQVYKSWLIKPNEVVSMVDPATGRHTLHVHPWMDLRTMEYRPPFWTRYTLGHREAERDRRRQKKLQRR
jgi:hypothetical protein